MAKARDLMSSALATVTPDTTVAEVAQIMRDRNIGDVLVMDDSKLRGIVTDRDIAARVVAAGEDPRTVPVKHFMTRDVVTGDANWNLEKVAEMMGKNQVRRLPILQKGKVVGIVSLGDVALRGRDEPRIAKSLRSISEPAPVAQAKGSGGALFKGLLFTALAGAATALVMSQRGGNQELQ